MKIENHQHQWKETSKLDIRCIICGKRIRNVQIALHELQSLPDAEKEAIILQIRRRYKLSQI
jgi:hypothetical protein